MRRSAPASMQPLQLLGRERRAPPVGVVALLVELELHVLRQLAGGRAARRRRAPAAHRRAPAARRRRGTGRAARRRRSSRASISPASPRAALAAARRSCAGEQLRDGAASPRPWRRGSASGATQGATMTRRADAATPAAPCGVAPRTAASAKQRVEQRRLRRHLRPAAGATERASASPRCSPRQTRVRARQALLDADAFGEQEELLEQLGMLAARRRKRARRRRLARRPGSIDVVRAELAPAGELRGEEAVEAQVVLVRAEEVDAQRQRHFVLGRELLERRAQRNAVGARIADRLRRSASECTCAAGPATSSSTAAVDEACSTLQAGARFEGEVGEPGVGVLAAISQAAREPLAHRGGRASS